MDKLSISQVDAIFANGSYPIEFLLYYKNSLKTKRIRLALKKLSSVFWPIFGEYQKGIIQFDRYSEKDFFNEEITENEFNTEEPSKNIYEKFSLVNLTKLKKLFYLKIIQFSNGTVLIPKMNHLVGDGYSYFYFLTTLAALSQKTYIPFRKNLINTIYKPHHQRTILKEFQFNGTDLEPLQEKENFTIEVEKISKATVQNVIKNIAKDSDQWVSTNDILSAMVIKKSVENQKDYFGDEIQLTIPIDVRRQVKEYGPKYFGNSIMLNTINFKTKEIEKSSINDIAIKIRKNMPAISKENYIKYLGKLEAIISNKKTDQLKPYNPQRGCLVTNLSKLPVNKLNFGTGYPDFIFPLTIAKNSAAILADQDNFILRLVY